MTKSEMLSSKESPWNLAAPHERILVIRESDPLGKRVAELLSQSIYEDESGKTIRESQPLLREFLDGQN